MVFYWQSVCGDNIIFILNLLTEYFYAAVYTFSILSVRKNNMNNINKIKWINKVNFSATDPAVCISLTLFKTATNK